MSADDRPFSFHYFCPCCGRPLLECLPPVAATLGRYVPVWDRESCGEAMPAVRSAAMPGG